MGFLEVLLAAAVGYFVLLLILEVVIWKAQPDMEGVVTLHVDAGGTTFKRKLYGFEYENRLYVASNHWFRSWYHAVLKNPELDVERGGELGPYTAVPIEGEEHDRVASAYNQGFALKLACGFAPQRFLRIDPRAA